MGVVNYTTQQRKNGAEWVKLGILFFKFPPHSRHLSNLFPPIPSNSTHFTAFPLLHSGFACRNVPCALELNNKNTARQQTWCLSEGGRDGGSCTFSTTMLASVPF